MKNLEKGEHYKNSENLEKSEHFWNSGKRQTRNIYEMVENIEIAYYTKIEKK